MTRLYETHSLSCQFRVRVSKFRKARILHAVNDVSIGVQRGDVLGIVGESGCGKSTFARMLLGLQEPTEGQVHFDGMDISRLPKGQLARHVQPVFQDPYSSLNPRKSVASIVSLPLRVHRYAGNVRQRALDILDRVGLPSRYADGTPGQLSGGQRQRVAIARALALNPDVVVCDEPTSALDVSIQAQILNLLMELRRDFNLTYIFISHNLAVVEHIATHVAVMYMGRVVEYADTASLFERPQHPYTQALLDSALTPVPGAGVPEIGLGTAFPDPLNRPSGCAFHPRCPIAIERCRRETPELLSTGPASVACHRVHQGDEDVSRHEAINS